MAKLACIYSTKDKTWSMPSYTVYIREQRFSKIIFRHGWYGRKLNDFQKVAEFFTTNSQIFENFLCEKIIDLAKNSPICFPRQ